MFTAIYSDSIVIFGMIWFKFVKLKLEMWFQFIFQFKKTLMFVGIGHFHLIMVRIFNRFNFIGLAQSLSLKHSKKKKDLFAHQTIRFSVAIMFFRRNNSQWRQSLNSVWNVNIPSNEWCEKVNGANVRPFIYFCLCFSMNAKWICSTVFDSQGGEKK